MPGHRRPADWELSGELADRPLATRQSLDDGASIGVAERVEGVVTQRLGHLSSNDDW
jgi:hypothetical protein